MAAALRERRGLIIDSVNINKLYNNITNYKKLSHSRDSARYGNGHSRSLKGIRCCANRRGIYDFLLVLNSNLTSIFNRS